MQELGHGDKLCNVSENVRKTIHVLSIKFFYYLQLPENRALAGICQGMIEAWNIQANPKAAILFVVEDITYNICDQVNYFCSFYHQCQFSKFLLIIFTLAFPRVLHS